MKSVDATIHIVQRCTIAPFFVSQSNNTAEYHLHCKGIDYFLYKQEKPRFFSKKIIPRELRLKKPYPHGLGFALKNLKNSIV